jgi:hypothetical protein
VLRSEEYDVRDQSGGERSTSGDVRVPREVVDKFTDWLDKKQEREWIDGYQEPWESTVP